MGPIIHIGRIEGGGEDVLSVSEAYKEAVADSHRKSKMRAVLKVGNAEINISDNDIIKDTVYVTNECTNGNEYEYGCVYSAELGITIKSAIDRYSLFDCEIRPYWSLWTGSEWEEIPLGVFYISQPDRINDKIKIKALDKMTMLDVNVAMDTQGTPIQLLKYMAEECGIELAQKSEELSSLPNANVLLSVFEKDVGTWRDVLSYICMLTASFAIFDRYGKLKIVQYATKESVTLTRKHRFQNATFSDYTTSFVGIKARFIAEENYAPYEESIAGEGLILDMGDIPIVRGLPETKHAILSTVLDVLKDVSYTPFELETLGNPALELGDYVKNVGVGRDGKTYLSPITYYYWTYRGKQKLRGVGGNPKLSGVTSKQGKQMSAIENSVESKTVVLKEYRNTDVIEFRENEVEIATINYSATENSKPIILLCVRIETDLDGILVLQFYTDGAKDTKRTFKQYLERGNHVVTVSDVHTVNNNERHTISVKAKMEYFESDTRKRNADNKTQSNFLDALKNTGATVSDNAVVFPTYTVESIDTTVASATINSGESVMVLYGQGIASEGKWDGTISFAESINVDIDFKGSLSFDTENFRENIDMGIQNPSGGTFNENVGDVAFSGRLVFANINAYVNIGEVIKEYVFSTENADKYTFDEYITANNDMFALKTIYTYDSKEEAIDSGKMCNVTIDYSGLNVESVVVENG